MVWNPGIMHGVLAGIFCTKNRDLISFTFSGIQAFDGKPGCPFPG